MRYIFSASETQRHKTQRGLGTPTPSAADVDAFMAHALMADVVIVDQNLDWQRDSYLGSASSTAVPETYPSYPKVFLF